MTLLSAQTAGSGGASTTGFTRSNNVDSQLTKAIPGNAGETLSKEDRKTGRQPARPSGIIYGIDKYGFYMINPLAPARYGDGRQYLTQNPSAMGPATRTGTGGEETREFGGLRLFGWDF